MNVNCDSSAFFKALLAAPDDCVVILRATGSELTVGDGGSRSGRASAVVTEQGVFRADVRRLREALRGFNHDSTISFVTEEADLLRVSELAGNQVRIVGAADPSWSHPSLAAGGTQRLSLPWAYRWTHVVSRIGTTASVLSVIGGVVLGTTHHGVVAVDWIVAGVLSAALWMAMAVGVELLADVGRSLRDIRPKGLR